MQWFNSVKYGGPVIFKLLDLLLQYVRVLNVRAYLSIPISF